MLDPRVYRAGFLPVLVALVLVAFSLGERPAPTTTALPGDAFDAERALTGPDGLTTLAAEFPERRAGSPGDAALADRVEEGLRACDPAAATVTDGPGPRLEGCGFETTRRSFRGETATGVRDLELVIGTRAGTSARRVVVVAHRDALSRPGLAELSGTAALLELSRLYEGRRLRKTLVLVSSTGGAEGLAGARELARALDDPGDAPVDAVLVLGDLASERPRRPFVVGASSTAATAPVALRRTVEAAVRQEAGTEPGGARTGGQWARLAVPAALGPQSPLVAAGLPAVALSVTGAVGPAAGAAISEDRLEAFGRAALRAVTAIDARSEPFGPPTADLVVRRKVLPAWAVSILAGALLLPALLAGTDGYFRLRRRHVPLGRWTLWLLLGAAPLLLAWLWLRALDLVGLVDSPPAPLPAVLSPGTAGWVAMAGAVVVAAVAWAGLRPLALRALGLRGSPAAGGPAGAMVVALGAVVVLAWATNPHLALLLVPAAHAWLLVAAPEARMPAPVAVLAVLAALLPPLAALAVTLGALGGGPADWPWTATQLLAGGHVSALAVVAGAVLIACAIAALTVVVGRARAEAAVADRQVTRGPSSYAGPGSLGGTESALRR